MDIEIGFILARLALGLGIGFVIGMTGVGGGVLVVPALTEVLGFGAVEAVGTASAYAFLCKIYAGFEHYRLRTIDFRTSNLFLIGAVPGNILTALAILYYKTTADPLAVAAFQNGLKVFIACVMIFSVLMMFFNKWWQRRQAAAGREKRAEGQGSTLIGICCGAIIGALIGSTSVGGGVLVVPMLILFFGLSTSRTVGSSIYIALALTLVTTLLYSAGPGIIAMLSDAVQAGAAKKEVEWVTAGIMAGGSIAGVYLGARLAVKMPEQLLQNCVIGLIIIAAGNMLYNCCKQDAKDDGQPAPETAGEGTVLQSAGIL